MEVSEKGRRVTQTSYNGEYDRLGLVQPALSLSAASRIKLKVQLSSWIGVGLLVLDELEQISMKFQYSDRVKGVYMVSSNGYSWWHNEVYSSNGVAFRDGDVLSIHFDPLTCRLEISTPNKLISTQVDRQLLLENNIYFGVNLSSENDSCLIL